MGMVFLILTVVACKNAENQIHQYPYSIVTDDSHTYELHLDDSTPANTEMLQFLAFNETSGNGVIALLNKFNNSIYIYDTAGNSIKTLKFNKEGEKGLVIGGFHFINNDSLLLFDYGKFLLYLVHVDSLLNPVRIRNVGGCDTLKYDQHFVMVNVNQPMFFSGGKVFLTGKVQITRGLKKVKSYGLSFSLEDTNNVRFASLNSDIWEKRFWHNEQYYIQQDLCSKDKIVFSFPMKDSITIYDYAKDSGSVYYAGSDLVSSEDSMYPRKKMSFENIGKLADIKSFLKLPSYRNIYYDKYRDVFIRVFSNGKKSNTLIILDGKFNKIGETELPADYLVSGGHFITKDGLYLRKHSKDESKIVFTLFKIVESK